LEQTDDSHKNDGCKDRLRKSTQQMREKKHGNENEAGSDGTGKRGFSANPFVDERGGQGMVL
jgi:hypothetical protein